MARTQRWPRAPKYSDDALKVPQTVWATSGGQCGQYLAAAISLLLDLLERSGELVFGTGRYSRAVRSELEAMSPATIDRYLAPTRAKDQLTGKLAHARSERPDMRHRLVAAELNWKPIDE